MFLVVGLVLPAAGSPQRFCMRYLALIAPGQSCAPCDADTDCDCDGTVNPGAPSCTAAAKLLPDALPPGHLVLAPPAALPMIPFATPTPRQSACSVTLPRRIPERGPPGDMPIYLLKRSLLL